MALVPIESLRYRVIRLLAKTLPPAGIELLSYKRDRSIAVFCLESDSYQVIERGFVEQKFTVDAAGLPPLLKTMIKREFPRSHKIRLSKCSSPDALLTARRRL